MLADHIGTFALRSDRLGTLHHVAIVLAILLSFQLSNIFALESERAHVLSITAGLISAVSFRYRTFAFPAIVVGLLIHYLFISQRGFAASLAFSTILPLLILCFSELYLRLKNRLDFTDLPSKAIAFIGVMVVLYPIANTIVMSGTAYLLSYPIMTEARYYGYSVISAALTQLVVTPSFFFVMALAHKRDREQVFRLDRAMQSQNVNTNSYILWLLACGVVIASSVMVDSFVTAGALSIVLVPLIGLGLGRFGYIVPTSFTLFIVLFNMYGAIKAHENGELEIITLYGLIAILFALCSIIFLMVAQAVKNYLTLKQAIDTERRDSYTRLYTLAQLKDDIKDTEQASTIVLIDLSEITRRVSSLGLDGKSELLKQLSDHLRKRNPLFHQGYIVPFTTSLLYLTTDKGSLREDLHGLFEDVLSFSFEWHTRSIKVLEPMVRYVHLDNDVVLESAVSQLCSPNRGTHDHSPIAEVFLSHEEDGTIQKLSQIQSAFANDDFELYAQVYKHLQVQNETAINFEVLLRLPSREGAVLSPAEFFPLIHEFGLEVELDKWVIRQTFKTLSEKVVNWQYIDRCGINLTAQALTQFELANYIRNCADQFSIPLNKICFEITESMPLANEKQATRNIKQLQSFGCKIALDDFGTGYASFDYLRRIPVDTLKVDGSFVKDIIDSQTDRAIVQNMSQIALDMGLETVAEFVETDQHAEILKSMNVKYAQGFGIAKPIPLQEVLQNIGASA